jgi:hypothetical protein
MTHKLRQTTILHCPSCLLHLIHWVSTESLCKSYPQESASKVKDFFFSQFLYYIVNFSWIYILLCKCNVSNLEELIIRV